MTPDEHYAKATEIMDWVNKIDPADNISAAQMANFIGSAQVHATLSTVQPHQMSDEEIAQAAARGTRAIGRR